MNAPLLDRVTYYVKALDPAFSRTLDDVVHDYATDDEPRQIARIGHTDTGRPQPNAVASHCWDARNFGPSHLHLPLLDVDGEVTDETIERIRVTLHRWSGGDGGEFPEAALGEIRVIPSSTLGHHHVYIATVIPEVAYMHALMDLASQRVIEPNYALVSIRRRATFLRLPGVKKLTTTN